MESSQRRKMIGVNVVFLILLLYIIAALVWWFISLEKQNSYILKLEKSALPAVLSPSGSSAPASLQQEVLMKEYHRNLRKYISEGVTFMLFILLGAGYVLRAIRRQWKDQQQQQDLMMAITHELKTPIAVAKLNLETLQKHLLDEQKKKKIVQMTLQETDRLDRLATNILLSAQLEGSSYIRTREYLDFSELVEKAISDFCRRYATREWKLSIQKSVEINGDALLLTLMINNLLENAVKYSQVSTPITCTLSKAGHEVVFSVADQGSGIPEGERKNIFTKFYRIGDEATRKTKGTGLGLYLCKKIAREHNADIFVTPCRPNGSIFVVRFN